MRELYIRSNGGKEPESVRTIPKEEIIELLTHEMFCRKRREWPLIRLPAECEKEEEYPIIEGFYTVKTKDNDAVAEFEGSVQRMYERFFGLEEILNKYAGHVVVAGGSVLGAVTECSDQRSGPPTDVDLFLVGIPEDELENFVIGLVGFISDKAIVAKYSVEVTWNERVINIFLDNGNEWDKTHYQIVLRSYPRKDMVVGGFDLGCCSILLDHEGIKTTELALWSIINRTLIVIPSCMSPSFGPRIVKHWSRKGFQVCFPGFKPSPLSEDLAVREALLDEIMASAKEQGLEGDRTIIVDRNTNLRLVEQVVMSTGRDGDEYFRFGEAAQKLCKPKGYFFMCGEGMDQRDIYGDMLGECFIAEEQCMKLTTESTREYLSKFLKWNKDYHHEIGPLWSIQEKKPGLAVRYNSWVKKTSVQDFISQDRDYENGAPREDEISEQFVERSNGKNLRSNKISFVLARLVIKSEPGSSEHQFRQALMKPEIPNDGYLLQLKFENNFAIYRTDDYRLRGVYIRNISHIAMEDTERIIHDSEDDCKLILKKWKYITLINLREAVAARKKLQFITKNPGGQFWTSSCEPIQMTASQFYGKNWNGLRIGIPDAVVGLIFKAQKTNHELWSMIPKEIVKYIFGLSVIF